MMGVLDNFRSSAWIYLTPVAAACAPIGVLRTYFNQHLRRPMRRLLPFLDPFVTIDIAAKPQDYSYSYYNSKAKSSDAYAEVLAYLSTVCSREARELRAEGADEGHGFVLSLREGQEVADEFEGVTMWWSAVAEEKASYRSSGRCCRLTFHERHRRLVVDEYLPYVRRTGQDVTVSNRPRRLYTNKKHHDHPREEVWSYIDFDHPTTFDTLAMDPDQKQNIMDDLEDFRNNKDYYRRIGRAWKRGYLLHGPPGTGKSTMIAAMANYLSYDVYDIELTTLHTNYDLRKLFIETKSKSIIVIEDIDCSLDLSGNRATTLPPSPTQDDEVVDDVASDRKRRRGSMLTLSGLLNFIDGLWSAHSGERIIVFTTNHLVKLDPALIRRGRMDKHIEMSYCRFEAFRTLAKNYLEVEENPLFDAIRELLQVVDITPADVAECMMMSERGARDADACLGSLLHELKKKLEEEEEQKKHDAKIATDGSKEKLPSENGKDNADEDASTRRRQNQIAGKSWPTE